MDKIRFTGLWDLYSGLLTPNRQEITNLYLNLDLTVSEIADQKGVSRQSVSECLALCKRELEEFEEKLGHEKMLKESELMLADKTAKLYIWAEEFLKKHPEYAADIAALNQIIKGDCAEEIRDASDGKEN